MMQVQRVPLEWVPRTWPLVADYIEQAAEYAADGMTEAEARVRCFDGAWTLLVVQEEGKILGAATVQFYNNATDRIAFITALGGRMITSKETFAQMKDLLKSMGATALEGAARESAARLYARYGLVEKHRIVGVAL